MRSSIFAFTILVIIASESYAADETKTAQMPFDDCRTRAASAIEKFKIKAAEVREFDHTPTRLNAKICTKDGSYTITCDKATDTMTTVRSPEPCK